MAKKVTINQNADLPPLMVLGSFLNEKKREFVTTKLKDFGLVRKEIFNRKLGHKKKDFPYKKFLGKRYRFVTAPMTDQEVDQLFSLVQTLLSITPKPEKEEKNSSSLSAVISVNQPAKKRKKRFSILAFILGVLSLVVLGIGGYQYYFITMTALSENLAVPDLILELGTQFIVLIMPAIILLSLSIILRSVKSLF